MLCCRGFANAEHWWINGVMLQAAATTGRQQAMLRQATVRATRRSRTCTCGCKSSISRWSWCYVVWSFASSWRTTRPGSARIHTCPATCVLHFSAQPSQRKGHNRRPFCKRPETVPFVHGDMVGQRLRHTLGHPALRKRPVPVGAHGAGVAVLWERLRLMPASWASSSRAL